PCLLYIPPAHPSTLVPYTTLFRSLPVERHLVRRVQLHLEGRDAVGIDPEGDVAVGLLLRVLQVRGVVARRQVRFGEGRVEAHAGRERDGPLPGLLARSLNHDATRG